MTDENNSSMLALQFEFKLSKLAKAKIKGRRNPSGYWAPGSPVKLGQMPIPKLPNEEWVLVKTVNSGICGSDMKELTLSGAIDNPLQSFVHFPQIMGHEAVGILDKVGSKVKIFTKGSRVAISPWLPCAARGIKPVCPRCAQGDFKHCQNFLRGDIPPGMHLGVTAGFGGFAEYIAVHQSQCFEIPQGVSFDQAVLADPFSVAFHSCLLLNPQSDQKIMVVGLGVIGLATIMCLRNLFGVKHIFAVGRYPFQGEKAQQFGVEKVFYTEGNTLIKEILEYFGADIYTPTNGLIWGMDGVDGIIDTIASSSTIEVDMRVLCSQGKLILSGVSTPKRTEMTPHYFKELEVIGSNAFAMEIYQGKEAHAFMFFLNFLAQNRIDTSQLLTHKFPLTEYQKAFDAESQKRTSKAIKIAFQFKENI